MAAQRVTYLNRQNTVYISADIPTGPLVIGQASFQQQIQKWQGFYGANGLYKQRLHPTDRVTIMAHIQSDPGNTSAGLYLCNEYGQEVLNLNLSPILKGIRLIGANRYNANGASIPLETYCWSFTFEYLQSISPTTLNEGLYYLKLENLWTGEPDLVYYSEPIRFTSFVDNTLYMDYSYATDTASKRVIVTGWYDDYSTNTIPYNLQFSARVEGYIINQPPKVVLINYRQQSYEQVQIKTDSITCFKMAIGEISVGIPYYMLDHIKEAVTADALFIGDSITRQMQYRLSSPPQTQPAELFKVRNSDVNPLVYASCELEWVTEDQWANASPPIAPYERIFTEEFDDTFS